MRSFMCKIIPTGFDHICQIKRLAVKIHNTLVTTDVNTHFMIILCHLKCQVSCSRISLGEIQELLNVTCNLTIQ